MKDPSGSSLADVANFLCKLEWARIRFTLASVRDGAVMVRVNVPGEHWEIEFFPDRPPEIEVFRTDGNIGGAELLEQLFKKHGD
jgi:hypothetical protein